MRGFQEDKWGDQIYMLEGSFWLQREVHIKASLDLGREQGGFSRNTGQRWAHDEPWNQNWAEHRGSWYLGSKLNNWSVGIEGVEGSVHIFLLSLWPKVVPLRDGRQQ